MKSKTLTKLIKCITVFAVLIVAVVTSDGVWEMSVMPVSRAHAGLIMAATFFILFFLLVSKIFSYLGLSAHKGLKIDDLIFLYRFFYVLLTDEARQEWRDFIAQERDRIVQ